MLIPSAVPHLDRPFDYAVPQPLRNRAQIGTRVRVRFAGRLMTGLVVEHKSHSDYKLTDIADVKGPPVLTPELAALTRVVAARGVGTWGDVLNAAIPARHARAERSVCDEHGRLPAAEPVTALHLRVGSPAGDGSAWSAFTSRLQAGDPTRAALSVPWAQELSDYVVEAVAAVSQAGRRVLVIAPDDQQVEAIKSAVTSQLEPSARLAVITAGSGPEARYRAYLKALAGQVDIVVGTRAAVFAPLPDLGLILVVDEDDTSLTDPQAPYWHAREVAGLRSIAADVPLLFASRSRSPETQRLVNLGWAAEVSPPRAVWRTGGPRIRLVDERDLARDAAAYSARLPKAAFEVARTGLAQGPVLVQVPRKGYVPVLACAQCRRRATCAVCEGDAALELQRTNRQPHCVRCGALAQPWSCPECGGTKFRAVRVGTGRTAQELGQAFPNVSVVASDSEVGIRRTVEPTPMLVVATPGAEPRVPGRYAAALLLDGDVLLAAPRLRAPQDALAKWAHAATLVDPAGQVLLIADPGAPAVQAMVRADPIGWADRELAQRVAARVPPAVRFISLAGPPEGVTELAQVAGDRLGRDLAVLGPVPAADGPRWLIVTDYAESLSVSSALAEAQRKRSKARAPVVTIRVDPDDLG